MQPASFANMVVLLSSTQTACGRTTPRYIQLCLDDPHNAADRTHAEATQWAVRLTMVAIEHSRNLIIDGTMRNPSSTMRPTPDWRTQCDSLKPKSWSTH